MKETINDVLELVSLITSLSAIFLSDNIYIIVVCIFLFLMILQLSNLISIGWMVVFYPLYAVALTGFTLLLDGFITSIYEEKERNKNEN